MKLIAAAMHWFDVICALECFAVLVGWGGWTLVRRVMRALGKKEVM